MALNTDILKRILLDALERECKAHLEKHEPIPMPKAAQCFVSERDYGEHFVRSTGSARIVPMRRSTIPSAPFAARFSRVISFRRMTRARIANQAIGAIAPVTLVFEELNMPSSALAERSTDLAAPAVTGDQLDLIRRTVASGASDTELKLYLYDCSRRGIHPLDKLLHFTKRGGKYTPVTSIDFMRSQAAMSGEMAGSDDPIFQDGDTHPIAATVTVYRMTQGQRFSYTATARWSEYCPDTAPMWKRMPHTMLGKCAEALALRKAFPQQLAGLYSREEMDQAETPAPEPARLHVQTVTFGNTHTKDPQADTFKAPAVVDTETGEDLAPAPEGYHYITGYSVKGDWHEADALQWDQQGGSLHLSTKLQKIGALLGKASNEHIPAKLDVTPRKDGPGRAYVNKVELWKPEATAPLGMPLNADEIPF